jgi:hypothetical protein
MKISEIINETIAPSFVPEYIWVLHEKERAANDALRPRNSPMDANGQCPTTGELKRRATMSFRRLSKAVMEYTNGSEELGLALMRKMNDVSRARDEYTELDEDGAGYCHKLDEDADEEQCPMCYGSGIEYEETCLRCGGKGYLINGEYDYEELDEEYEPYVDNTPDEPIRIKIGGNNKAKEWIKKIYAQFQEWPYADNQRVMAWDETGKYIRPEDEKQASQFAVFELEPSMTKKDAVEIKWIMADPQRQGVGEKALTILKQLAHNDSIVLTLFPWDKGRVSQAALTRFYRKNGFNAIKKGSKSMLWSPLKEEQ